MPHTLDVVPPREAAGSASGVNDSPRTSHSASAATSPSAYARWRNSRKTDISDRSLSHSLPAGSPSPAAVVSTMNEETPKGSVLIAVRASRSRKEEGRRSSSEQNASVASETLPSTSIEERSFRLGLSMAADASNSELPRHARRDLEGRREGHHNTLQDGEGAVRWSLASLGGRSRRRGGAHRGSQSSEKSPAAVTIDSAETGRATVSIAEAVPQIAQKQTSAAEAYARRWSRELQQSTTTEEELRQIYQQLEQELVRTRRAASAAETRHKRELDHLKRQLEQEKTERVKAEQDREDLLLQVTVSPSLTPRAGEVTPSAERVEDAKGRSDCNSTSSAYVSSVFYDKLKEREERARARVRREFVRQAQERLYAEQRKRSEAEKAEEMALKRLVKAEEELLQLREAVQEGVSVMEAKDVQLHERAIHVQELEAHIRLLERQLAAAEEAGRLSTESAAKNQEEAKDPADQRQAGLEAQRRLAHQLQEKIGLAPRHRFDRERKQEGVRRTMDEPQARCHHLEEELATEVRQATALSEETRQCAEDEVLLLRCRNADLEQRCVAVGGELAESLARLRHVECEMEQLRARSEQVISECHVEIRSLQLRLECATKGERRCSLGSGTAQEIEREQRVALVHQYAAEARAAQEELGCLKEQLHREKRKHLDTVLDLSHQITTLKRANTQLEHAVNVCTHDSTDAARLLLRAHEELSQLREERRRLSVSLVDLREESRASSAVSSYDSLRRRIAELEGVQKDLSDRLHAANGRIRYLQSLPPVTADQPGGGCALNGQHHRNGSPSSIFVLRTNSSSQASDAAQEAQRAAYDEATSTPRRFKLDMHMPTSGRGRESPAALPDLLESIAQQLQSITRDIEQQPDPSGQRSLHTAALPLQGRRRWQSMRPEEREALDRVRVSCLAALECCHLRRTSSPFYSSFRDGAEERTARRAAASPSPVAALAGGGGGGAARSRSSSTADRCALHQQNFHDAAQQATHAELPHDHVPQVPLERPRRSFQSPRRSVVGDDNSLARFSHTSAVTPNVVTEKASLDDASSARQRVGPEQSAGRKSGVDDSGVVQCIQSHFSVCLRRRKREELPSEPCWGDDEGAKWMERGERAGRTMALSRSGSETCAAEVSPAQRRRSGAAPRIQVPSGASNAV
ncbi:hypothetical protein LSCM1_01440 [Leishmania martiniquensis]|uniref:Uncharacterized protein n=1 Tax=Leishmania martiniquensis TaxID=1580590 RepID=A0A836H5K3_9TRYP|nr:hypothetical protein LSCM1_01440 [Leishmania martiniquensis]